MDLPPPDPMEVTMEEVLQAMSVAYAQLALDLTALRVAHTKLMEAYTRLSGGNGVRPPTPSSPPAPAAPA